MPNSPVVLHATCSHSPSLRITGTDLCMACMPDEFECPACEGESYSVGGLRIECETCDSTGTVRKRTADRLLEMIARVRVRQMAHDPDGFDRNLAAAILLTFKVEDR